MVDNYTTLPPKKQRGEVITFYSYKGGVGRSMALANIAALLAKWGKRVLIIDWDLEAPGLENFYSKFLDFDTISEKKGLIDLLMLNDLDSDQILGQIRWSDYIVKVSDELAELYLITSGKKKDEYASKVRAFSISKFFDEDGGKFLEGLRNYWLTQFDFVFIDSRTGLTDSSGVCSIHMPDVLVMLFTLNEQSVKGSIEVANKASKFHSKIIYDRLKLKILPIPTRIENNESRSREVWLQRIAEDLIPLFDWLPRNEKNGQVFSFTPKELINQIKVPYVPQYAYGEQLPAIQKGTSDPQDIGFVYETIAAVFGNNFNNIDLLKDSRDKFIKIAKGEVKEKVAEQNLEEWLQYVPKPRTLTSNEQWNVFLSYRSVDRSWVISLYDVLTELGYKVFLDMYEVKPGQESHAFVDEALQTSQAGILISSRTSAGSAWITREYEPLERMDTVNANFTLLPIIIGDSRPPTLENEQEKLPGFLTNKMVIDFTAYPDGPNGGDLLRLLYAINEAPLTEGAVLFANKLDEITPLAFAQVNTAIRNRASDRLLDLFENGGLPWQITPALGCNTAEGLMKLERFEEAIKVLDQLQNTFSKSLRPKKLKAIVLLRRRRDGDLDLAQSILGELYAKNSIDPETLGIYARSWMDRYAMSNSRSDLIQSRELYVEAFEKAPDDYYLGINAATKSVFIGTDKDLERAAKYASRIEDIIGTKESVGDYWKTATIAEVFLIQKKYKEAAEMYEKAVRMAKSETASHKSTYQQAIRLLNSLNPSVEDRELIDRAFLHIYS